MSDAFDERHAQIQAAFEDETGDPRLPDAADHAAALVTLRDTLLPRLISGKLRALEVQPVQEATA